jgi:hypothetical protein
MNVSSYLSKVLSRNRKKQIQKIETSFEYRKKLKKCFGTSNVSF